MVANSCRDIIRIHCRVPHQSLRCLGSRKFVSLLACALQLPVHDQRIDGAERWMQERARKPAHNFKSQALPQAHRAFVAAYHEIELHRTKSASFGMLQRMLAHGPRYAASPRPRRRRVPAIRDVRSPATLIRPQIIRSENLAVFFRNEHLMSRRPPVGKTILTTHIRRQGVRIPAPNHRFEDSPNRVVVAGSRRSDVHRGIISASGQAVPRLHPAAAPRVVWPIPQTRAAHFSRRKCWRS